MKNKIVITAIFALFNVFIFRVLSQNINTEQLIKLGEKDSVYSKVLNENRSIWVHVPESSKMNKANSYPVLYVLDGGEHFLSICSILNQLSPGEVPEMIVVGIANRNNRTRDLTPTKVEEARGAANWVKDSGGGETFTTFIKQELIPYIDNKYPTENYKTLIGHSFGGLLVVNTMIQHPELFKNYIAIDPSLWWDNEVLSKDIAKKLINESYQNKSLFISLANPLSPDKEKRLEKLVKDQSFQTEGIRAIYNFSKIISESKTSKLNFKHKFYENESHGTVPLISMYDGLKFLFSWYKMKSSFVEVMSNPDAPIEAVETVFNDRFVRLSNTLGYTMKPEEDLLNSLGYMYLSRTPEKASLFFAMAIKHYPESANVYDSMADYYLSKKEYDKALKHVTKAYKINAIDYYKKRIEDISKMKQ